jgi:L-lactate utilization protein LutB
MLNDFTPYPGALFKHFLDADALEPIVAYSCNMCDQCTLVCPEEYKFAELFGLFRKDMVKANGGESPMPGHKAIKMHQLLGFSSFFCVKCKGAKI